MNPGQPRVKYRDVAPPVRGDQSVADGPVVARGASGVAGIVPTYVSIPLGYRALSLTAA